MICNCPFILRTQHQRHICYRALFGFKTGTIPAVNALSCQTSNIPVKRPPSSPSSWWPVNCWSVAWHRQGKLIPGESSRSEAVSTKAKYTAMHLNETGDRRVERGLVKVDGRRERGRKCQWFYVCQKGNMHKRHRGGETERITGRNESNCMFVCVCACVRACACVCVRARESKGKYIVTLQMNKSPLWINHKDLYLREETNWRQVMFIFCKETSRDVSLKTALKSASLSLSKVLFLIIITNNN